MKDKKHKIDYFSENLAVPEIHVESADEASDNGDEMVFDNLAIPEIKIRHKKNKQ